MHVIPVAYTRFVNELAQDATDDGWQPHGDLNDDDQASSQLAEFAGRACYQSWPRPNPATATVEGYLANIIKQGHHSVLEHGSVSFYFTGVSRSFTHELVRHRHFSYSQLSQRFVRVTEGTQYIVPPNIRGNALAQDILDRAWIDAIKHYEHLLTALLVGHEGDSLTKKEIAEAARCVLPNMTPTELVVTGNHRAWRHFLDMRATLAADIEIRQVAMEVYRHLVEMEPALYADFHVEVKDDKEYLTRG